MKYISSGTQLRVLLADDDIDDRQMLREAIEHDRVDLALHNVSDGAQLMDYLSVCNGNAPDLIFLDLNLPLKNGLECLTEIRALQKFNKTVIVIYSASSAKDEIERTFHAGANIYITKQSNFHKLKKIVAEVLSINWQYHTSRMDKNNFVMMR